MIVKDLTVKVTYKVGLGNVEMPDEVYKQLLEAVENIDEIDSATPRAKYIAASDWLVQNIKEADCMEWTAEIDDISAVDDSDA